MLDFTASVLEMNHKSPIESMVKKKKKREREMEQGRLRVSLTRSPFILIMNGTNINYSIWKESYMTTCHCLL